VTALLVAATVAAGYLVGRARPARRVSDWAAWQFIGRPVPRSSWRWWAAQPIFAAEIARLLIVRPRHTARAWRTRNDPPPRSPAPVLRDVTREDIP
jgi:hypothetical protein